MNMPITKMSGKFVAGEAVIYLSVDRKILTLGRWWKKVDGQKSLKILLDKNR